MNSSGPTTSYDVVIVGAGASGTLVAANLVRRGRSGVRLALVERSRRFGQGAAYSTRSQSHLLNVRAGRMSAFAEHPEHFLRWLLSVGVASDPDEFVTRELYGRYLASLIDDSIARLSGDVVSVDPLDRGCRLALGDGSTLDARVAVLALGNRPPSNLPVPDGGLHSSGRYHRSLTLDRPIAELRTGEGILILGTGLSMIDAVLSLVDQNHLGSIHALSRHGLLPLAHAERPGVHFELPTPSTVRELGRTLRAGAKERADRGDGWEQVIDAVRPNSARQWAQLSIAERRRFLRHARALWDVHRHRIAPRIAQRLQRLLDEGRLRLHAGRILGFSMEADLVDVRFRPRGEARVETLRVGHVINCTGPGSPETASEPVLRRLLEDGHARLDPLRLGLETDGEGALLAGGGRPSTRLFTLGPQRLGELWETMAIPEIRLQAAGLAERIDAALA